MTAPPEPDLDIFRAIRRERLDPSDWQPALARTDSHDPADWRWEASRYVAAPDVVEAVNVAIALGKPLLVTGAPGVGKSALAGAVAWQLGLPAPEVFVAKSSSEEKDLFYTYDALARFYAIEVKRSAASGDGGAPGPARDRSWARRFAEPEEPLHFIEYTALGRAILRAHPESAVGTFLLPQPDPEAGDFLHRGQGTRSVVLVDEIDKASSDFCNDLLDAFDKLRFAVPEVSATRTPILAPAMRPIVVITSNRERELPPAFLRRCVFAHIPMPEPLPEGAEARPGDYRIENILAERLDHSETYSPLTASILALIVRVRRRHPDRPPGISEAIEALGYARMMKADWSRPLTAQAALHARILPILAKTERDRGIVETELAGAGPGAG